MPRSAAVSRGVRGRDPREEAIDRVRVISEEAPFRRRVAILVGTVSALALLVAVGFLAFGDPAPRVSASTDTVSRSAIGHRALVTLLRELDIPVLISRGETAERLDEDSVLVMAEPSVEVTERVVTRTRELFDQADRVLFVLPKWSGMPDESRPEHLLLARLRPSHEIEQVLERARVRADVVRDDAPALPWDTGPFGIEPELDSPQLLGGSDLVPLITHPGGNVLLGRVPPRPGRPGDRRLILSDPDLVATHGVVRADNALLVARIFDWLRAGDDSVVVFDETLHGTIVARNPFAELTRFPLVLFLVQTLTAGAVLVLGALVRFGPVEPPPAPVARTPGFRVRNTAELMRVGGHSSLALRRYFADTVRRLATALHYGGRSRDSDRLRFLAEVARHKGVRTEPDSLVEHVRAAAESGRPRAILRAARATHAFETEILDGPRSRT